MKRLLPGLLSAVVVLSFTASDADAQSVRRRPSFIERLFGIEPRVEPRQPRSFAKRAQRSRVIITRGGQLDDGDYSRPRSKRYLFGNNNDDVAPPDELFPKVKQRRAKPKPVIARTPKIEKPAKPTRIALSAPVQAPLPKKIPVTVDEPEPVAGFGMGNLPYLPPKVVKLYNANAMSFFADGVEEEALRNVFFDENGPLTVDEKDRVAIFEFYAANGYKPLWTKGGMVASRASLVLDVLSKADDEGLIAANYLPQGLDNFSVDLKTWRLDSKQSAQFDVALTIAALRYARHISGGQFNPDKLSLYNDINPPTVDSKVALKVVAYSPYPDQYLNSLAPQLPQYAAFKNELRSLGAAMGGGARIPDDGAVVKKGQRDPRIPKLREFLLAESHLAPADALVEETERDVLDKALSSALKSFQTAQTIKATGVLDKATLVALNKDNTAERRNALIVNLERARWLPRDLGDNYVRVNQAAFELNVVRARQEVWATKVVVGAPLTQTNAFHDKMENVVFNPTWTMPQSIIMNEYMKKLRANPGHFDKIGYEVFDKNGEKVKSSSVQWSKYDKAVPYNVVQPSGGANALGELKFNFPNSHAIYLHDTPAKSLFARSMRAYSHGCIRVENPKGLAEVLLGWDKAAVEEATKGDELRATPIVESFAVHLTYFTAWPDASGTMRYFKDVYERDLTMLDALSRMRGFLKEPRDFKILASIGAPVETAYVPLDPVLSQAQAAVAPSVIPVVAPVAKPVKVVVSLAANSPEVESGLRPNAVGELMPTHAQ